MKMCYDATYFSVSWFLAPVVLDSLFHTPVFGLLQTLLLAPSFLFLTLHVNITTRENLTKLCYDVNNNLNHPLKYCYRGE